MLCTTASAICDIAPKSTSDCCHAALHAALHFGGNDYLFTTPVLPGDLMTKEKLISREFHQKSPGM